MSYSVVIPARNEAENIIYTLTSIKNQTLEPNSIVVVDDSSSDNTSEIAESAGAKVIKIYRKSKVSALGTPYLAYVINKGLAFLENEKISYILISGAECIYKNDYVELLMKNMIRDKVVVASGIIEGERTSQLGVRGAGRLINFKWFKSVGFRYPLNYGFESWLIFKALSTGFKVKVYPNIKFHILRKTSMNISKAYFYGKAMKALNYTSLFLLGRVLRMLVRRRVSEAKYMLLGYVHGESNYDDLKNIVKYVQARRLLLFRL